MNKNSKVWLISQEADDLKERWNRPVRKELICEFANGNAITEDSSGPLYLPVGYVIEHQNKRGHVWREYDKGFAVEKNTVGYSVISGVEIGKLEGQLLTVIDASFSDKAQCESVKSLVRNTLWGFNKQHEEKIEAMFMSTAEAEE